VFKYQSVRQLHICDMGKVFSVILLLSADCAALSSDKEAQLEWIIGKPFEDDGSLSKRSHLVVQSSASDVILEFGPRL